jgi:xanthine dehydrogenase accessory factor
MYLTEEGRNIVRRYRAMNEELNRVAGKLFQDYFFTDRYTKKSESDLIIVRGGGDLATGTIHRLWSAGYAVLVLEAEHPAAIRRQVSLCEAVYEGTSCIEGMEGVRIETPDQASEIIRQGKVPVLVDPEGAAIKQLHPAVVVDAILAKRNLGTNREMADLTIGLGPGFVAGEDVDLVIETKRGHNLGRIIRQGSAAPNSGVPGIIGGYGKERVIHAAAEGILHNIHQIGDVVEQGETIAVIEGDGESIPVTATITGIIRGLIRDGYPVTKGFKIADIDPRREELQNCFTISDKARCIAGSVLEVVSAAFANRRKNR